MKIRQTLRTFLTTLTLAVAVDAYAYSQDFQNTDQEYYVNDIDDSDDLAALNEDGCDDYDCECECYKIPAHFFYIGPEVYHVKRLKAGGTQQTGFLYGFKANYDHVKRYRLYWGIEASYATGQISGHSGRGAKLVSNLTDMEIEGRFGYTFQLANEYRPSISPFVGVGYFNQINNFKHPSPIPIHYQDRFKYVTVGFISNVFFTPNLSAGANFKAKYMFEGKSRVTHDPDFPSTTLAMEERTQYALDLPFSYYGCLYYENLSLSFVPFFQYRHYGPHENFPFDFLETKFINIGARLLCGYAF